MMKHTLTAAALAVVLATPAFAQSAKPETAMKPDTATQSQMNKPDTQMNKLDTQMDKSATTSKSSTSGAATADQANFIQNQDSTDWRGSKLIGATVYGPDNKSIGDINDVLIANDGKINAVVIGVGGFLGVGEKSVAIPFDKLQVSRKADSSAIEKVTVSYSKDELKNAPKFAYYEPASKSTSTTGAGSNSATKPMTPMGSPTKK
ncbi:MAG TPA: PRC-barrel domain-containing protein [Pseudolabrys sp.]|nr:PRC-barrel domain-containing protein [Pseudolabrys sp.]